MTRRTLLGATAMIASVAITACSDTTAPKNDKLLSGVAASVTEVTFTKWITAFPAMTGFTGGDIPGTFAGELLGLKQFDNGVILQLQARYEVTDPSGNRSFKALIEGKQNNNTGEAVLNGVITEGWLIGAHVHVTFQVITPCQFGTGNLCFQGTIRIQRG